MKKTTSTKKINFFLFIGDDGIRTHDIQLAKLALSQLSYVPEPAKAENFKFEILNSNWAREESNFRPHAYQACALTN